MKTSIKFFGRGIGMLAWLLFLILSALPPIRAQSKLRLREAINKAVDSRALLKAEAECISIAQGLEKQSELFANPVFQFENQNLRPGQTNGRDVDTYAFLTQPLDVLGKRKQRIAVAADEVSRSEAGFELIKRQVTQSTALSYWELAARKKNGIY